MRSALQIRARRTLTYPIAALIGLLSPAAMLVAYYMIEHTAIPPSQVEADPT